MKVTASKMNDHNRLPISDAARCCPSWRDLPAMSIPASRFLSGRFQRIPVPLGLGLPFHSHGLPSRGGGPAPLPHQKSCNEWISTPFSPVVPQCCMLSSRQTFVASGHLFLLAPGSSLLLVLFSWSEKLSVSQTVTSNSFFFFFFLRPYLWHMEVPAPGVEPELQLPAYTTVTAIQDPI